MAGGAKLSGAINRHLAQAAQQLDLKCLLSSVLSSSPPGTAYGARVVRAPLIMLGNTSQIRPDGTGLFAGLPKTIAARRYHSLMSLLSTPGSVKRASGL